MHTEYVNLHRSFHQLVPASSATGAPEPSLQANGKHYDWQQVLDLYRVVILSEAGAGKTEEIRRACKRLRDDGKSAFFLRLEHLKGGSRSINTAFETGLGDAASFHAWLVGTDPGWLMLDSVDESRLDSPKDFERAIRAIAFVIGGSLQRTHLIITGRPHAWRPASDLALCDGQLPYTGRQQADNLDDAEDESIEFTEPVDAAPAVSHGPTGIEDRTSFTILALDDLTDGQITAFAQQRGIHDPRALLDALERADARPHVARPLDLEEVISYWRENGSIGSRLELIESNIRRRLTEQDPDRGEKDGLTADEAQRGARQIAAASVLTRNPEINVPGAAPGTPGLRLNEILPGWNNQRGTQLLGRPVFDEALYGTVRLADLTYREFLAAEYFRDLLKNPGSRRMIEQLFFCERFGVEVVVPSMRPLLPWLAIWDQRIRDRALRTAPEVLLSGGDPRKLPPELREQLLRTYCRRVANLEVQAWSLDGSDIERFAASDLEHVIEQLLEQHADNDQVLSFLLRMVWRGQLRGLLQPALRLATDCDQDSQVRTLAVRGACAADLKAALSALQPHLDAEPSLDRLILSEIVSVLPIDAAAIDWLGASLLRASGPGQYEYDPLKYATSEFVGRLPLQLLPQLVSHLAQFFGEPVAADDESGGMVLTHGWVLEPAVRCLERLAEAQHPGALAPAALRVIDALAGESYVLDRPTHKVPGLMQQWRPMAYAYLWHVIETERVAAVARGKEPVAYLWSHRLLESSIQFDSADYEPILKQLGQRSLLADRRRVLQLAFGLYVDGGRGPTRLQKLKAAIKDVPQLQEDLHRLLHPPPRLTQDIEWKKRKEARNRKTAKEAAQNKKRLEKDKQYLIEHVDKVRDGKAMIQPHVYLLQRLRAGGVSNQWLRADWQQLTATYGDDVAKAFRDAAVDFWRRNRPQLQSEGAEPNRTPMTVIFGLLGLAIEAAEVPDWLDGLTPKDAELATRYAILELNGFPSWLPQLHARFPQEVTRVLHAEVRYQLATESQDQPSYYVLHDAARAGHWLWDSMSPLLLDDLRQAEPRIARSLELLLNILQGSATISDADLAALARAKCRADLGADQLAIWAATWAGVAPADALGWMRQRLDSLKQDQATEMAMRFLVGLVGGRAKASRVRSAFKTPVLLKELYLLAHKHVCRIEDIDRAGKGVYSPGLRDDAQDARENLFRMLNELPGKEAYAAILEVAEALPEDYSTPYLRMQARRKAEQEADGAPWTMVQFGEFVRTQELVPSTARNLFDLIRQRLEDLRDHLEEGDESLASLLIQVKGETEHRKYFAKELRDKSAGLYNVAQEDELADAMRPDLRVNGTGLDNPLPIELKMADNWSGNELFERLEVQLCCGYTRDLRTRFGIFALVWQGMKRSWDIPDGRRVDFAGLLDALRQRWRKVAPTAPGIDDIAVLGIDLTKRGRKR